MVRKRATSDSAQEAEAGGVSATRRNWSEVWDSFDRRQKAKVSNDVEAPEDSGEDMFARAGVAAECGVGSELDRSGQ